MHELDQHELLENSKGEEPVRCCVSLRVAQCDSTSRHRDNSLRTAEQHVRGVTHGHHKDVGTSAPIEVSNGNRLGKRPRAV